MILKPQYIKRKILHFNHFHLCQVYHHPQASIYQRKIFNFHLCRIYQTPQASTYSEADFWFSSLSNISTSTSINIPGGRFSSLSNISTSSSLNNIESIYHEADFSFSSLSQIYSSSSLNILRKRVFVFIFVKYIIIFKPQYFKR